MKNKKIKIENFSTNTKTIMNKSLNLNTLKNNYFKNTLKLGITAIFIMALGTTNAQTDPDATDADSETGTASPTLKKGLGDGASVKLIDNKGTIKYLQTNNGITSITSTASGSATTTTWQLGGTLVDATTITTSGNEFTIDGEEFNLKSTGVNDSAAATTVDDSASGFTLLVREEVSGRITKMLASELVSSIRVIYTQSADNTANDEEITVTGLPALTSASQLGKLFVFRNGAKLRDTEDFAVEAGNITTKSNTIPLYKGDVIEIQYIK